MAASSSGNSSGTGNNGAEDMLVPMVMDTLSFERRQDMQRTEIVRRIEKEKAKKTKDWDEKVETMRREMLDLYPNDKNWGSEELLTDPRVRKRRGSTDVLDRRRMKTMFMDYPDSGRRFKVRFDVGEYSPDSVRVSCDKERIIVRATKLLDDGDNREFVRKIEKPKEVDHNKLKSYLTSDGILIIDCAINLNLRKLSHSPSHSSHGSHASHASSRSLSPSSTPKAQGQSPKTPQKLGAPIFHDIDSGKRRFSLIIDVGTAFAPKDVTVQVIKDNRIQVKGRREERTSDKFSKHKYNREFELPEKIESFTLRAGLSEEGHLMVGAWAKGSARGLTKHEAGDRIAAALGIGNEEKDLHKVCNVLDLASFPPTNLATGTISQFTSENKLSEAGSSTSVASSS